MDAGHTRIGAHRRPDGSDPSLAVDGSLSWNRAGTEFTTTIEIPEAAVPKEGSFLWLSIAGRSRGGVDIDVDPVKAGDQPNTHHFVMLDIEDYYLVTLAAEFRSFGHSRREIRGTVYEGTSRSILRPQEMAMRLLPSRWSHLELEELAATAEQIGRLGESFPAYREGATRQIAKFEGMIRDNPALRSNLEAAIARNRAYLAGLERLKEVYDRIRPRVQTLLDVLQGYRSYQFHFERSGPVAVRFAGGENYHSRRTDYPATTVSPADFASEVMEARAPGWAVDDWREIEGWESRLASLPGHPDDWWGPHSGGTVLHVWRFDPAQMAAARELASLGIEVPEESDPEITLMASGLAKDVRELVDVFRKQLEFFTPDQPVTDGTATFRPLPDVLGSRLFRLDTSLISPWVSQDAVGTTTRNSYNAGGRRVQTSESRGGFQSGPFSAFGGEVWSIGSASGLMAASHLTHGFPVPSGQGPIVVTGQSFEDRFFGDLHGRTRGPEGGVSHSRLHWHIERNGQPGGGAGHARAPVTEVARSSPGPRSRTEPARDEPEAARDRPTRGGARDGVARGGRSDSEDEPFADEDGGAREHEPAAPPGAETTGELPPPRPAEERPFRGGRPTFVAATNTGTVLGSIATEPGLDPGRIAVYLDGPGLGAPEPATVTVEVGGAQGFQYGFHGVPVGGSVVFRNVGDREVTVRSRSRHHTEEVRIPAGEERSWTFAQTGTIALIDDRDRRMRILVAPSEHLVVMDGRAYAFRNVPPGTHVLRVRAAERDVRPLAVEVGVRAGAITDRDVTLEALDRPQ